MAFQLKSFNEILTMTKQMIDDALIPSRVKKAKARAVIAISQYEEKIISLEQEAYKLCTAEELDFDKIADKMIEIDLSIRRKEKIEQIVEELFPETTKI